MNQLCKVCGEPAAGYHFGAFTCEGCKSFFGRTYNNLSALGECKNNGECVINKKNRTSCKSCRLKKCLMVGMSKSGSRYGRRSNWFKIHCLIQDQQEMSNRMAEQGLAGKNGNDDLNSKLNDPKDFLVKYKENEMRNSSTTNSLNELNSRISPRLTSPNSSEGSLGRSVSSPYSSLFEGAKVPNFPNPYLPSNNNFNANDFQKEFNNLANRFNPAATIPMTPISPLSPLNAAVSRLLLQNTNAFLGKRFTELQKLQNEQLLSASRFLPLHTLNSVLKPTSKDIVEEMTTGMRDYYADLPEQEGPIDLSTKRISDYKELSLTSETKCSKQVPRDHDSGFSPSSNEDNHNTSPLDLTSKRQCLMSLRNLNNNDSLIDVDRVDDDDEDEETSDVEVHDEMDEDRPQLPETARHEIQCSP